MWLRSPAQINGFLFGVCKTTEIPCNLTSTACNAYQCWDPNQIKRLVFEGFCKFLWIRQRFYFCSRSIPMPFSSPMHWFPVRNPCSWRKPAFCFRFRLEPELLPAEYPMPASIKACLALRCAYFNTMPFWSPLQRKLQSVFSGIHFGVRIFLPNFPVLQK